MFSVFSVLVVCASLINSGVAQSPCITPNGETGKCVEFTQCQAFIEIWRSRTSKNIVFFRASRCGWEGMDPKVCCGSFAEYTSTPNPLILKASSISTFPPIRIPTLTETTNPKMQLTTLTPESTETTELYTSPPVYTSKINLLSSTPPLQISKYSSHPNIHMVPQRGECGYQNSNTDKIFGGNETAIDEYPWIALLGYKYEDVETFNCGGSLINERYVLTAAHCVAGKNLIKVRLGEYNTSQNPDCVLYEDYSDCAPVYQEFTIEEKIWFDTYTPRNQNRWNDIALLRLDRNVTYSDFVRPICLPMNGERSSPKDILTVAGWGLTEFNVTSEIKLHVQVPLWSQMGCIEVYSIGYNVNLTEKQFCAGGQPGKDSCTGDSGGPLMRRYPGDTDFYMEGIVSFGPRPCGRTATPGVYVRVSEYIDWILDNLKPF